jgi:hypothetical protein
MDSSKTKANLEPNTSSWTLTTPCIKNETKSIDKKIPWTLDHKDGKTSTHDQKCASEMREFSESCSEQFRRAQCSSIPRGNVNFDDTTPEELAAYFDHMLHIPKTMSAMAEMMYT